MNVDNQTLMHIRAGHLPPKDLLEQILAHKPTAFGFAVQAANELSVVRADGTEASLKKLIELGEQAKDFPWTAYFGKLAEGVSKDDIQPFVLYDGNNSPTFAIFAEGTFNGLDNKGHTEQAMLSGELLMPKLIEYLEDFEGDIDKVIKKLKSDAFSKALHATFGHRAVVQFIPITGDIITFEHNNQLGQTGDWGYVSNIHCFPPIKAAAPEPVAKPAEKRSFWSSKTPTGSTSPNSPPPVVEPVKADPPPDTGTPGNVDKPVTGKVEKPSTMLVARPPSWIHKNEDVKLWYTLVFGSVPGHWKKRLPTEVKNLEATQITSLDDLHKLAGSRRKDLLEESTATMTPKADPGENLPMINSKDMEKILDFVTKHLDGQSKEIIDPKQMQDIEKKIPSFSEQLGVKPGETLNWPVAGLFALGRTDYRAIVLYAIEMRALWRSKLTAQELADISVAPKSTVVTTNTDLGNGSTKTESIDTAPLPAKKGSFWSTKAA